MMLRLEKEDRRSQLINALGELELTLRDDSFICHDYIENGERANIPNVHNIVQKMAQARYLHQYCNFKLGYQIAHGVMRYNGSHFPQQKWFEVVSRCVLLTTVDGKFPSEWPWLRGVSPADYKRRHDLTQHIMCR